MESKICTKCNTNKPLTEYYTITNKKTGKIYCYNYCKKCHYAKMTKRTSKVWRKQNPNRWKKDVSKAQKAMFERDKKGVYLLVTTKGLYVGSSNKIKHRIQQHKVNYFPGNVKYYGAKVLFSYILAIENDRKTRLKLEREWIEKLQPKLNYMYTDAYVHHTKRNK